MSSIKAHCPSKLLRQPTARYQTFLWPLLLAALLLGCLPTAFGQVSITTQPQSPVNTVGDNVEIYVVATAGTPPIAYQWYSNSVAIVNATNSILVLTNVQLGYSGSAYTVVVSDAQPSQQTSSPGTLTVNSTFSASAGLVMWLPFDDGLTTPSSQSAADASGNNNNGTLQSFESDGNEWVGGRQGGALFFANTNGLTNNIVIVNDAANLNFANNLAFSVSAWVASTPYYWFEGSLYNSSWSGDREAQGGGILTKGFGNGGEQYDLDVYPNSGNFFRFFVRNAGGSTTAGVSSSTALNTNGVWQHVVATCDVNLGVTNISLYVNGALIGSSAVAFNNLLADGGLPVTIGNRSASSTSGYNQPFVGVIDDARIYNYALSASDVSALYNSYAATNPAIFQVAVPPIYPGGNMPLNAFEGGAPGPVTNLWSFTGANALSGTNKSSLIISNLAAGLNGTATLIVSNATGLATTNSFAINAASAYTEAAAVMSLKPLAFWQLNEPTASAGSPATSVIYDYANGNNGFALPSVTLGNAGVPNSTYNGFPANYDSAAMVPGNAAGFVYVPPFGLTSFGNGVTFTAWINLNSSPPSSSQGIIYSRSGQGGGMFWNGYIGYTWNGNSGTTYNINTHLVPASGTWAFAAVSIGSGNTTIYMATNGVIVSYSTNMSNTETSPSWTNYGLIFIGEDSNSGTVGTVNTARIFPGKINNVAVFPSALTAAQIQYLYYSAGTLPRITGLPASTNLSIGQNATFTAAVTGMTNLNYLWYIITTNGASNTIASGVLNSGFVNNPASATLTNIVTAQNGATVYLSVSNPFGTTVSNLTLNVFAAPAILSIAPASDIIYSGESPTFAVSAAGPNLHYQWSTNSHAITSATNASVTLPAPALGAYTVTCTVTNLVGSTSTNASLSVISVPTAGYPQAVLALHPLGYWRLNEANDGNNDGNAGQACHDYINGNNGMFTNTLLAQPGYNMQDAAFPNYDSETCAQFDTNSTAQSCAYGIPNIDFSASAGNSAEFSVAAWVNGLGQSGTAPGIAAKGLFNNEEFTLDTGASGESYRFELRDATGTGYNANSTLAASDNKWHHLVGVCDQSHSNVTLYIDGLKAASASIAPGAGIYSSDAAVPMSIGARSSTVAAGYDQQFNGYINDVAVFTNALTAAQVEQLYTSAGISPTVVLATNLVAVDENGTATNSAAANGTAPLAYQWYYIDGGGNTNLISGDISNSIVLADVQTSQSSYQYFIVVTNVYGAVTSSVFTLSIASGGPNLVQDISPLSLDLYAGLPESFSVRVTGTEPFSYSWLLNGSPIPDATNATYSFPLALGTNTYQCVITNIDGPASSSTATFIGAPPPNDPYSIALIADGALAYWRLNEPSGTTVAYDYIGGYNGTYGVDTTNGLSGVPNPPFEGFGDELAVSMDNSVATVGAGYVTTAGINLYTNTATLLCWAYSYATQTNPVGLVFLRNGTNVFGSQIGAADYFDYTWANNAATYNYGSGLVLPIGVWSMLALTTTPTNAILYLFSPNGHGSATNNVANPPESFAGPGVCIGADPQGSTLPGRIFNGKLDEVALFDYTLSAAQLSQLYSLASAGLTLTIQSSGNNAIVTWPFGSLQSASSLNGPWSDVVGATSPYTNALSAAQIYYRVSAQTP